MTRIPALGLGVWQVPDGPECEQAVLDALELGYRHIDTAQAYGNEASVGRALRAGGVPRDEVFVTTKFQPSRQDAAAEAARSLERLGLDRVDLYIVHWPRGGATWMWPGMEQALERGYARAIGVSNYSLAEVDEVLATASSPPTANQVQFSPFEYRRALLDGCADRGLALEAYSPLGTGRHLGDPEVERIAESLGATPAQVLLAWCRQRGAVVLAKSTRRERLDENLRSLALQVPEDDLRVLDALDRTGGTAEARESKWW
jgi:diketogulonate reductase-like aldo/keto reductase